MALHEYSINQRSGWASFSRIMGFFGLAMLLLTFYWRFRLVQDASHQEEELFVMLCAMFGAASFNCFFMGFLIDVFTDIRWFAKVSAQQQMAILREMEKRRAEGE